jgi:transcription initiation factor TFIIIB Brf1 subunit/transcription initiation factor TFIIB
MNNFKEKVCIKCGNKNFEYDEYFNEYSCQNCGWILDSKQENDRYFDSKDNQESNSEKAEAEISRLNEIIIDLRQKGKQAVASRDRWKERAELAERKQNESSQNNDYKFMQVKKMFSKMYHPDSLTGDRFEKLIKQEIFKEFWQIIENIEKNNNQ